MLKRRQMCTAECAKILRRYNEMRLTSNDQRRRPSPTPKYRGSGLKRLSLDKVIFISKCNVIFSAYSPLTRRRPDVEEVPVVPSVDWSQVSALIQPVELLLQSHVEHFLDVYAHTVSIHAITCLLHILTLKDVMFQNIFEMNV